MFESRTGKTLRRLDEMLEAAINGTFEESRFDETQLSRLESRWKQYLTMSERSLKQTRQERENMKKLVSDISHQTRTSLSNILLYTELLEDQTENEDSKKLARQILSQTKKLEFLIQALVKMSRLETDILEVTPVQQPIRLLVERAVEEMIPRAEEKQIQIVCSLPENAQAVYDLKWTAEALGNILDNAVKYSPAGSQITVEGREFEIYACITVTDQGIGIQESEKAQIFGRFYRSAQVQQEDGIGIGLYLAREILRRENGYIKVCAREGTGSSFSVYLKR
ncbi:MAG: HAMP domain-containing histidine kinase [Lachnospiraceae bacterium]|nr:HAMP domain-containing histidine kinase [Lachnospiraceae bacterium]MCI9389742.1 HAMP domain-containing histidine kinase [Lachnospiraceae bacterium]MCI9471712.1 HAMP domain-containing histidine kinase [Lachnospiraceae bacterium]